MLDGRGFANLAAKVHAKGLLFFLLRWTAKYIFTGLKLGIHVMHGIARDTINSTKFTVLGRSFGECNRNINNKNNK